MKHVSTWIEASSIFACFSFFSQHDLLWRFEKSYFGWIITLVTCMHLKSTSPLVETIHNLEQDPPQDNGKLKGSWTFCHLVRHASLRFKLFSASPRRKKYSTLWFEFQPQFLLLSDWRNSWECPISKFRQQHNLMSSSSFLHKFIFAFSF